MAGKGQPKTGGRTKGVANKRTMAVRAGLDTSGLTPAAFLLKVMRDTKKPLAVRIDAARSVAPYIHPKLTAVKTVGENVELGLAALIAQSAEDGDGE